MPKRTKSVGGNGGVTRSNRERSVATLAEGGTRRFESCPPTSTIPDRLIGGEVRRVVRQGNRVVEMWIQPIGKSKIEVVRWQA